MQTNKSARFGSLLRLRAKARAIFGHGRHRWRLARGRGDPAPALVPEAFEALTSVCLFWGPYRNLTTISAAAFGVHPAVVVLNHGGPFVFPDQRLDIIRDPTDATISRFAKFAVRHAEAGERGDRGGSISLSHAADDPGVARAYRERTSTTATCLIWKESQAVTNRARRLGRTSADLVNANHRLRFVMPVRDPIACARSNMRTGHARRLRGNPRSFDRVLDVIVEEIATFAATSSVADRHFMFFEDDAPAEIVRSFFSFCEMDYADDDVVRSSAVLRFRPSTPHTASELRAFEGSLRRHLGDQPELAARLRRLVARASVA